MSQRFRVGLWLTFAWFLLIFSPVSYAQTAVDGAIGGTVLDAAGAVVGGATVTVHNNATNAEQVATTDTSGYFRVIHLQPGAYNVTIAAGGFDTFRSVNLTVQVGLLTDMEARMRVGSSAQTVQVSGEAPAINTTSPDFSGVIGQNVLNDLPVNNYRWSSYALQTPAVVESGGFGLLSFRGQSTLLNNVTVDGADDNQAFFSEERGRTTVGYSTPKSAIQEFQVNTSNYSTEYGRAAGGVVNAITKSGGNVFHGEGYYLDRDSQWAAFNDFTDESVQETPGGPFTSVPFKPTDLRKQYGFGVGGPIIRDKLFFFFAADRYYHDFPAVGVASSPSTFFSTPNAVLPGGLTCPGGGNAISNVTSSPNYDPNFYADNGACTLQTNLNLPTYAAGVTKYTQGLTGLNSLLGQGPRFADQTLFFPRLDWQINAKNHATFEANRLRFISPSGQQTNAVVNYGLESFGNIYVRDTWGLAKLDTLITSSVSNEIRYQYGRDFNFAFNEQPTPYENSALLHTPSGYVNPNGIPPNVNITNAFQFGTPTFLNRPAYPDERRWQVSDTVVWIRGNHSIKFGVDYIHTYDLAENLTSVFGAFTYGNSGTTSGLSSYLSDFYLSQNPATVSQAAHYTGFQQGFGPLGFQFTTGDYAGFIQDEWKFRPRLSLTLGLRYEFEQTPNPQLPNPLVPQTESFPSDKNNIAPRVGFAYDVFGGGKTVVRGGYGIFNARLINSTIYNAIAQTGTAGGQSVIPSLSPGQTGAPVFPQIISGATGTQPPPSVIFFDKHFQLPQIHQADLTLEQNIGWNTVFSVSWLGAFGRELPDFVDQNLPAPGSITYTVVNNTSKGVLPNGAVITTPFYGYPSSSPVKGGPTIKAPADSGRPDTRYSSKTDIFSGVNSNYQALVAQVSHRLSHNIQFQANYTWSHALDYGENNTTFTSTNSMLDPRNLRADYGNSVQNVPNRFIATAIATSPWRVHGWKSYLLNDYEFSPSFSGQNGNPYSGGLTGASSNLVSASSPTGFVTGVSSGTGSFNGTDGSVRIPNLQRNAFQLPRTYIFDARLSKRFTVHEGYQLELLAESFNLANHQNVTSVQTTAYSLGTATDSSTGKLYNTLTQYTTPIIGTPTNSNNNNIYSPRQFQLGARLQF